MLCITHRHPQKLLVLSNYTLWTRFCHIPGISVECLWQVPQFAFCTLASIFSFLIHLSLTVVYCTVCMLTDASLFCADTLTYTNYVHSSILPFTFIWHLLVHTKRVIVRCPKSGLTTALLGGSVRMRAVFISTSLLFCFGWSGISCNWYYKKRGSTLPTHFHAIRCQRQRFTPSRYP